ncbi:MAG: hypothetical protein OXC60_08345 [Litoreibacter sp.]|nr:hypothetical protein [Litoreibacter sp.]
MKPPTETKFYENTVNYRGRLGLQSGKIRIAGSFVTRLPSANTGLDMRAEGVCDRKG